MDLWELVSAAGKACVCVYVCVTNQSLALVGVMSGSPAAPTTTTTLNSAVPCMWRPAGKPVHVPEPLSLCLLLLSLLTCSEALSYWSSSLEKEGEMFGSLIDYLPYLNIVPALSGSRNIVHVCVFIWLGSGAVQTFLSDLTCTRSFVLCRSLAGTLSNEMGFIS